MEENPTILGALVALVEAADVAITAEAAEEAIPEAALDIAMVMVAVAAEVMWPLSPQV